ncbi:anhydro-N-acetylmuramic acid kinase [Extensimonas vulgaris]|uniref:Anhydro-N-acetylmuramic acid kinase n=1 Tax=Extensimonas vulgaris TaxID=1031594 RepID=A0A369AG74_9BURK|nr:anhydro-N-acetylmuramic acid kinase [Extensimonas vulgaris]RCX08143.1 anhydro-N-acetylmuramic acid kinase [Extensimonas vulgaris]TWI36326.1 anhydro-N-acetylmuramic acid kinase [Extensimonas vulgaris]TXD13671.1 anhydro-N-acetylmuramic acid kinase [Extensimonas vulgaris]
MSELYIGLMSGTSLDGVDGVLVDFSEQKMAVVAAASAPLAPELKAQLLALHHPAHDELHQAALAGNAIARSYAQVVQQLLAASGARPAAVRALGAHGQTVRHRPLAFDGTGYTLQLGNPALLAELCGITVVADFRSRDLAAGGQGAPLVPAFHRQVFGRAGETVLVLNLGGIANLSVLRADGSVLGFDCGPGNMLLDHWCQQHTGQPYDAQGAWAARGQVLPALLATLQQEPFFHASPPKSTGRDLFNAAWLAERLRAYLAEHAPPAPEDVQATLAELTASACAESALRYGRNSKLLAVCGGGAYNADLLQRLQRRLPQHAVQPTDALGLPAQQVEAAAFAWLARQALRGEPGSLPSVTGARGARVLGAIYPA